MWTSEFSASQVAVNSETSTEHSWRSSARTRRRVARLTTSTLNVFDSTAAHASQGHTHYRTQLVGTGRAPWRRCRRWIRQQYITHVLFVLRDQLVWKINSYNNNTAEIPDYRLSSTIYSVQFADSLVDKHELSSYFVNIGCDFKI